MTAILGFLAKPGNTNNGGNPFDLSSDIEATDLILSGIPWKYAFDLQRAYGLTDGDLARILDVSVRTLVRHRNSQALLPTAESDRLFRTADLLAWAMEVLEDKRRAMAWLRRPQLGLGDRVPMELIAAGTGVRQVRQLLGRIEYGVYS